MRILILSCFILLFLFGCNNEPGKKQKNDLEYFDAKGYFDREVIRLTKSSPLIVKTVMVDGSPETKEQKIKDWKKELAVFAETDINRASWKGLFQLNKLKNLMVYRSDDEKVPVKEVVVIYKNNKVHGLLILVKNSNYLYTSVDSLSYYPDSLYQIKKTQNIKLLTKKNYTILGKFQK